MGDSIAAGKNMLGREEAILKPQAFLQKRIGELLAARRSEKVGNEWVVWFELEAGLDPWISLRVDAATGDVTMESGAL